MVTARINMYGHVKGAGAIEAAPTQPHSVREGTSTRSLFVVYLFIIGLLIPFKISVEDLLLFPYRFLAIIVFVPVMFKWLSGSASGYRVADFLVLLHGAWVATSLFYVHGFSESIEPAGVYFIDFVIPYFIARVFITTADEFYRVWRFFYTLVLCLLPFTFYEAVTGHYILLEVLNAIYPSHNIAHWPQRLGLTRALGVFEHPILYGVFCGFGFAIAYYVVASSGRFLASVLASVPIFIATFFSLSMGPILGIIVQSGLIGWDVLTRWLSARWPLFIAGLISAYVAVDLLSNRSPIEVLISYIALQDNSAYNRVLIWMFGTAEVARNPIFGIGFNDWERPEWMYDTVDNFWLLTAMRHGLPALIFMVGAMAAIVWMLSRRDFRDIRLQKYRKAWIFTLVGVIVVGASVHFWNQTFCLFALFLGSGVWMLGARDEESDGAAGNSKNKTRHRRRSHGRAL